MKLNLSVFAKIDCGLIGLLNWVLGLAVLAELAIMVGNLVLRFCTGESWIWSQEAGQMAISVIAFVGGAVAYERGEHMAMHFVVERLSEKWKKILDAAGSWLLICMAATAGYVSVLVLQSRLHETFVTLPISQAWFIAPMTASMALFVYFAAKRLCRHPRKTVLATGLALGFFTVLLLLAEVFLGFPGDGNNTLWVVFTIFIILLVIGVPIGFVLPTSSLLYLYYSGRAPIEAIPQTMVGGIISVVLLAIPFFILAGLIITQGGISRRLAGFVVSLVGHFRGGLLQVAVICMYIVSGLSGSKLADLAAVGLTMKDMLKSNNYDPSESTAVFAASTVMGETIPPSIIMLILASITSLSVGALFLAGILPAVTIAICLMFAIYVRARLQNMPSGTRASFKEVLLETITAIPSLAIPIFLIGGIVTGFSTPTEASSTAVVYAALLAGCYYKEINLRSLWQMMIDTAVKAGMILYICSAAFSFSWSLTVANVPQNIATMLISIAHMPWLFMLCTIITLVVMGALLEGVPALMIFGPLLMPIAEKFGIDPLQYGIVLIISMGLGTFLPGIGIGMYVACAIGEVTMEQVTPRMFPYLVVLTLGLLLVAYIPSISLIMPHLFMK